MNQVVTEAIRILGLGMGTVFFVLLVFFLLVKGMQLIFPPND